MHSHTAIWKRHDLPGHEACRIVPLDDGWQVAGTAVLAHEGRPCRLDYDISCDASWVTLAAVVTGWVGEQTIDRRIVRNSQGQWQLDRRPVSAVSGCVDVDLNFTPSTNLLPVRRLALAVGATHAVRAAWLRFPSFTLEPLEQTYTRLDERTYRYESAGGSFVAQVTVDDFGLALNYANLWSREIGA